jgi:hypothetical protein
MLFITDLQVNNQFIVHMGEGVMFLVITMAGITLRSKLIDRIVSLGRQQEFN